MPECASTPDNPGKQDIAVLCRWTLFVLPGKCLADFFCTHSVVWPKMVQPALPPAGAACAEMVVNVGQLWLGPSAGPRIAQRFDKDACNHCSTRADDASQAWQPGHQTALLDLPLRAVLQGSEPLGKQIQSRDLAPIPQRQTGPHRRW